MPLICVCVCVILPVILLIKQQKFENYGPFGIFKEFLKKEQPQWPPPSHHRDGEDNDVKSNMTCGLYSFQTLL